jgi:protein-tyrosine kinase
MVKVDITSLRAAGMLPEDFAGHFLAEQYRRVKRPILEKMQALHEARVPGARLFMIAGALPGDGKTFTSLNLAASIARERDLSVLLVDADVAKRHITSVLGLKDEPGLLDALLDTSLNVDSLILPTDIDGISILPSGRPHEAATELLSSTRMANILGHLSERDPTRIVMFDTSPVLLSSESRAIAKLVSQIALVVRAGVTPQLAVREALELLPADKLTGLVLNHSRSGALDHTYGYGYDYHFYGQHPVQRSAAAAPFADGAPPPRSALKLARPADLKRRST